jgi:glycosyltransferase involved in cell wall biosynthesis
MDSIDVVIPWRDTGEPYRRSHFWHLRCHYGQQFNVVVGNNANDFNRSAARNAGVAQTTSDVIAVIDADNLIDPLQILEAVAVARHTSRMVKPFEDFGYVDQRTTDIYYATGQIPNDPSWENDGLTPGFTGGAYVLRRDAWDRLGGFDEAFIGWGGEDDAFHIHAERTLGPVLSVPGNDYHLWHPTSSRWTSPENYQRLMDNYVNKGGQ